MPIYEFVCNECNTRVEFLFRTANEQVELTCSRCGSRALQRVLSSVNAVTDSGGNRGAATPSVEERSCPTGTCSTVTLPGHSR